MSSIPSQPSHPPTPSSKTTSTPTPAQITSPHQHPTPPTSVEVTALSKERCGRVTKFTSEEDLMILREVSAAKAHIAGFGETKKRFQIAAACANENPTLREKVSWKSVQDRYKRLREVATRADRWNQRVSGMGGGLGEVEELLSTMREAKEDLDGKREATKTAAREIEEEKDRVGMALVEMATKRAGSDDLGEPRSSKKQKKVIAAAQEGEGDIEVFGKHLRDADMARIELERERLAFERDRYESEREERRREREEHANLELEKMKLLIQALNKRQ